MPHAPLMCLYNIQFHIQKKDFQSGEKQKKEDIITIAVVAAPNIAINDKTETCPMNVAMASKTNTPYTYGCCIK